MREQERAPRKYELMTILHPEVADETLPDELDRLQGYITAAGGELIDSLRDSPWGRRRLAYPIRSGSRDVRDGYYTVWHFSIGPSRLDELERELKLNTQVIRYIIVSWEPKPLTEKEIEAAEIAAEDAAAAEYAAAVAAQAAAEAEETTVAESTDETKVETAAAADAGAAEGAGTEQAAAMGIVAQPESAESAEELTAEAEAVEATGAELAIEPVEEAASAVEAVEAVEERVELQDEAAAALAKAEADAQVEADAATAAVAGAGAAPEAEAETEVPEGAVQGDGSGDCPEDYPVKGNASSKLYHTPGSPSYKRTNPEFCFASVEAAEAAGFGPTKYEAAQEQDEGEGEG